jgi:hypothetical protein
MSFTPHCFIGIGATGAMFTLRETYLHEYHTRERVYREVRSFHIQNLGTTPDESIEKAQDMAKSRGLELNTTREKLDDELRAIKRATAEELAERERQMKEHMLESAKLAAQRQEEWLCRALTSGSCKGNGYHRDARGWTTGKSFDRNQVEIDGRMYNTGWAYRLAETRPTHWSVTFIAGKYAGKTLDQVGEIDRPYIEWMAKREQFYGVDDELRSLRAQAWLESHPAEAEKNEYFGAVGERLEVQLRVRNVKLLDTEEQSFGFRAAHYRKLLVKGVDPEGRAVTVWYTGHDWNPETGGVYKLKGTVKKQAEFRGVCETTLQRVKEIK